MRLTEQQIVHFQKIIWSFYHQHGRRFAWRETNDPYHIFLSEVMLQQTQTSRVESKYEHFLTAFPAVHILAHASLRDVLYVWQGLGYNRRAKALYDAAQIIVESHQGVVPCDPEQLITLPGIGPATAASISAFAYNRPTVFIETNIRAVFIHFFFPDNDQVHDNQIRPLVEQTLDQSAPRLWYYALMDYGVMVKKEHKNPSRKSAHYATQSRFQGSDRQIRGAIVRALAHEEKLAYQALHTTVQDDIGPVEHSRFEAILTQLCDEHLVEFDGAVCRVKSDLSVKHHKRA